MIKSEQHLHQYGAPQNKKTSSYEAFRIDYINSAPCPLKQVQKGLEYHFPKMYAKRDGLHLDKLQYA